MVSSRIDDLRRRVEADPASIAFAQLAEEYRRAGQAEEAIRVAREGLTRHPGYLSARVTLGRALIEVGELEEARAELQFVAAEAPENLAAVRGLAEIYHSDGDAPAALEYFQRALALARHDPELEEIVQQLSRQVGAESGPSSGLTFEEAHQELMSAADRVPLAQPAPTAEPAPPVVEVPMEGATAPFDFDTLVAALGTPAAPPLVEAVVSGETPELFTLPAAPAAEAADPFAVLEAELRGQPGDALAEADVAEDVASELAALVDVFAPVAVEPSNEPDHAGVETAADVVSPAVVDGAVIANDAPADASAPAAPWPALEPPAIAPDALASLLGTAAEPVAPAAEPDAPASEDVLQSVAAVIEGAEPIEAEAAPLVADTFVGDAIVADDPVAPSALSESADVPEPFAAAETAEAAQAEVVAAAQVHAPEGQEGSPTPSGEAGDPPDAPAARQGEDVLGDLESWLHTLQERSDQQ